MRGRRPLIAAVPGLVLAVAAGCAAVNGSASGSGSTPGDGSGSGPGSTALPAVRFAVQPRDPLETWVRGLPQFAITDDLRRRPGPRPLYRFEPDATAEQLVQRAAEALGVAGRPQRATLNGAASWSVPNADAAVLTVGDWPARALSYAAASHSDPLLCKGSVAASADRRCPDGAPPLRYDDAAALRDAAALGQRLAPGAALDWRAGPSGGGTTVVEARFGPAGQDGPVLWQVSFSRTGRVVGVLAVLAPLRSVGDYPTISVAEAVSRLDADWLPRAPFVWGGPVVGCAVAPPSPTGASDLTRPATRPVAMPMTTMAPGGGYPLPLATAAHTYEVLDDSRCGQYLAPVVLFLGPGGDRLPVLALPDQAIEHLPPPVPTASTPSAPPAS